MIGIQGEILSKATINKKYFADNDVNAIANTTRQLKKLLHP